MVQEVHHNDLTAALAAPVAVLDFNATWCGPCKMLGPVLEEVSNEMADKAAFFGIDCDENPQLAAQFGVSSIPCLVVLKNGKMVTGILPLGVPFGDPKGTEKVPATSDSARLTAARRRFLYNGTRPHQSFLAPLEGSSLAAGEEWLL